MGMKQRDYLFDNYKAFLIILVVVGHFIELTSAENDLLVAMKWIIFSFHMPAFVFISGYFSRKKQSLYRLVQQLLVPYLIFEVLYYVLYIVILKRDTQLALLYPKFSLWYLLAMFMWKLVTPLVKKIPGYLWISFLIGLLVGASSLDDNYLTLPRMFTFYPFFLLGTDLDRQSIDVLRTRFTREQAFGMFTLINVILAWVALKSDLSVKIFYGRYDYEYLDLTNAQGIALRLLCYLISLLMIYIVAILIPGAQNNFSSLGQKTMSVYLFHGLIFAVFRRGEKFYQSFGIEVETVILLGASVLTIWLLCQKPFIKFVDRITHLPLPQLKLHKNRT